MTESVKVIHDDALQAMRAMSDGAFDAVITDPPFGVRGEAWDDMNDRTLARFSMAWMSEARRLAPELVVFCNQSHVIKDLARLLYRNVREMIWFKPPGSQYAGGRECGVWYAYEVILHCHDRATWSVVEPKDAEVGRIIKEARERAGLSRGGVDIAIRGKKTGLCYRWEEGACLPTPEQAGKLAEVLGLDGEFSAAMERAAEAKAETVAKTRSLASEHAARAVDVFSHRTVTKGKHPCEKPIGLMIDLIEAVGGEYKTILDPFAGSGKTGVACLKTGRRCVLIERESRYIPVIEGNLTGAATPLFDGLPA